MTWVLVAAAVMLTIGALCALYRMAVGPTTLNRALALDVLVTMLVTVIGLQIAITRSALAVPILLVLAMVGFLGSVAVARYAPREEKRDG